MAASPNTGVNTLTGEGLAGALDTADVVVDLSSAPSWEDAAVLEFFQTSTQSPRRRSQGWRRPSRGSVHRRVRPRTRQRVPAGEGRPGEAHHRLRCPVHARRATQFFEFVQRIIDGATDGNTVHLAPVLFQPIAADDVANAVGEAATGAPVNGIVEIAGPDQFRLDELARSTLASRQDSREVVTDSAARCFGAVLEERSLVPADGARIAGTHLEDWRVQTAHKQ